MYKKLLITASLIFGMNSYSSESIGFYSSGSINHASSIDDYDGHFEKLFRSRKRLYATDHLLIFISEFTNEFFADHPEIERFQIGDISAVHGGKVSRHSSHQNGLDVDVVYLRVNKKGQDVDYGEWGEYFVKGGKVTKNLDVEKNWKLFNSIVAKGNVGRIFVDKAVKQKFCNAYGGTRNKLEKETLRRLRPAVNHLTHFHLRLKCHKSHHRCKAQSDPANSTGCTKLTIENL